MSPGNKGINNDITFLTRISEKDKQNMYNLDN